ncbi:NAD(P)-binding protein [Xylariomycetidae sp. FL2044]|nr:NAD(P)-binding protein [Xylariomycetidae sp. FL2044]
MPSDENGCWTLSGQDGLTSLKYEPAASSAGDGNLGPEDVLVELHAASLNYRDLIIAKANTSKTPIPLPAKPSVVPASDGAGKIFAVGSSVATLRPDLKPGVDVVTHMCPDLPDGALPGYEDISSGLGQQVDGTLRRRGVFRLGALVRKPAGLSYAQAATMTCSGVTAWNALMGLEGRRLKAGDWVLVQGTGGVSVAALQIAVAAGATVIATTSSDAKASRLRELGAAHVLNYRATSAWGAEARKLTPGQKGVDFVVDIGGLKTLPESLQAIRRDGIIAMGGFVGGFDAAPVDIMTTLHRICILRGVLLGSRDMLREMGEFLEEKTVDIALDDDGVMFGLEDALGAYERLEGQKHFSKVVITMN